MMLKFATCTLATLLVIVASYGTNADASSSSSSSLRGVRRNTVSQATGWSLHPNDNTRRRLKLEQDNECVLLLKDIQVEDHTIKEDLWVCEFPYSRAVKEFKGREFMDIDVPKEVIDSMNPTSGASVLKTRGAYIEETIDTRVMKMHVPKDAEMEVITLHATDSRHYKAKFNLHG